MLYPDVREPGPTVVGEPTDRACSSSVQAVFSSSALASMGWDDKPPPRWTKFSKAGVLLIRRLSSPPFMGCRESRDSTVARHDHPPEVAHQVTEWVQ
jgi:hypothetical protein